MVKVPNVGIFPHILRIGPPTPVSIPNRVRFGFLNKFPMGYCAVLIGDTMPKNHVFEASILFATGKGKMRIQFSHNELEAATKVSPIHT